MMMWFGVGTQFLAAFFAIMFNHNKKVDYLSSFFFLSVWRYWMNVDIGHPAALLDDVQSWFGRRLERP